MIIPNSNPIINAKRGLKSLKNSPTYALLLVTISLISKKLALATGISSLNIGKNYATY